MKSNHFLEERTGFGSRRRKDGLDGIRMVPDGSDGPDGFGQAIAGHRTIAVHHGNSQIPGDTLHLASETVLGKHHYGKLVEDLNVRIWLRIRLHV